ncbi:Mbov_0395 family pilin-like conjugal transfer protein [Patescibacteria group bacterium]
MKKDNARKITKSTILIIMLFCFCMLSLLVVPSFTPLHAQNLWDKQVGLGDDPNQDIAQAFGHTSDPKDVREIVAMLIYVFLGFLGTIFLVLIIWAGYKWMTAAGNEEQIREAKKQIGTAVIGITIIMLAYSITQFVTNCVYQISTQHIWMCG